MITSILAQASAGGAGIMGQVFLFGSIILIMYFFMIRPQQKKQKETKKFIEEIKKRGLNRHHWWTSRKSLFDRWRYSDDGTRSRI